MQITLQVKLVTTSEQQALLHQTLQTCNAACDHISELAFDLKVFRHFDLHPFVYEPTRKAFPGLHSNHVVRAIAKTCQAYKLNQDALRTFRPDGAVELDARTLTWFIDKQMVSLSTTQGRIKLAFLCSAEQKQRLQTCKLGQADLICQEGDFYLSVAVTVEEPSVYTPDGSIGIDLGLVNIAATSEGNLTTSEPIQKIRRKYRKLRASLQAKKTRSARKRMAKLRRKESRFVKDTNHCLTKRLVQEATQRQKALVIEALTGIRDRGNRFHRRLRTDLNQWSFRQFKEFLSYKCRLAGVPLVEIDPRYSSQQCSRCNHTERANRISQDRFCCRCCGFECQADVNAACALKNRVDLSAYPMFHLAARRSQ
jgi:putative transposase